MAVQYNGWMTQLNTMKIYQANLHKKKQPKVRPKARRNEEENDIRKMGIVN
jgi:hypothetical protein